MDHFQGVRASGEPTFRQQRKSSQYRIGHDQPFFGRVWYGCPNLVAAPIRSATRTQFNLLSPWTLVEGSLLQNVGITRTTSAELDSVPVVHESAAKGVAGEMGSHMMPICHF